MRNGNLERLLRACGEGWIVIHVGRGLSGERNGSGDYEIVLVSDPEDM